MFADESVIIYYHLTIGQGILTLVSEKLENWLIFKLISA